MEQYPDYQTYEKLYKRFYSRPAGSLIELVGSVAGKRVLDLCGGSGRLSLEAARLGAEEVVLVDREERMMGLPAKLNPRIRVEVDTVDSYIKSSVKDKKQFDFIFCQQAVNYWLCEEIASFLAAFLRGGGVFVFNTFNKRPPEKPLVKEYQLDGDNFVEVSWLVGDIVHHVQVREGMPCHLTSFHWLSPERLARMLNPYFLLDVKVEGGASLYRCLKK